MQSQNQIVVAGINSADLHRCFTCANQLHAQYPDRVAEPTLITLFPAQWDLYMKKLTNQKKGNFYSHRGNIIVYLAENDMYIGGSENFKEWALQEYRYVDNTVNLIYKKQASDAYKKTIHDTEGRSYV